jgi:succinate dehydrogenase hydrophobic anchor subunit
MKIPPDRVVGALAFFLTPLLPLLAGVTGAACYPVFRMFIEDAHGRAVAPAPWISRCVLEHFNALLWGLFVVAVLLTGASALQLCVGDAVRRMGRQFALALAGAVTGMVFLVGFVTAVAQAVFARL